MAASALAPDVGVAAARVPRRFVFWATALTGCAPRPPRGAAMKTRVMQNEPDEPIAHERPADRPGKTRNNLASTMARWARRRARRRSSAGST
jgi:hypothetical protein